MGPRLPRFSRFALMLVLGLALLTAAASAAVQRTTRAWFENDLALRAEWRGVLALPSGRVHVSALPVREGERELGFAVLVHDMSFVAAREKEARRFLFMAFAVLAVAASVLTQLAARMSWRSFTAEL